MRCAGGAVGRGLLAFATIAAGLLASAGAAEARTPVRLAVLSNRADLISGGNALVRVTAPRARLRKLRLTLGRRNVKSAFARRPGGRFEGLITGLRDGRNVLTARLPDGSGARITITNHPSGGPVFAGPQVQPWFCQTEQNALGKPLDAQCDVPPKYEFFYKSTDPTKSSLQPYDPSHPPSDVATTTTDQGVTVPFIVRRETGTIDRSIYSIAVLYNPTRPWQPWAPQPQWNHKLDYPFGGSCGPEHRGLPGEDVLDTSGMSGQLQGTGHAGYALARGFAVASTGLNILGQDCNTVVSAEALMMLKEHIVESYGPLRYTIGEGCSGGSIQQQNIAAEYPGLLNGIMPQCSFPDAITTGNDVVDCSLMQHYFTQESPQLWLVAQQQGWAAGHQSPSACVSWHTVYGFDQTENPGGPGSASPLDDPTGSTGAIVSCGVPQDEVYNAQTKPTGARCTLQDYEQAIWGPRPPSVWGPVERRLGHGFARLPYDNVGVQYGLTALESGLITPEQFVDLNQKIGSYDIDFQWQPQRHAADPGSLPIAYRSGQVTNGRELANVPIVDLRGTSNQEIHNDYRSYATRERLKQANGNADNQVIFTAGTPLAVPQDVSDKAFNLIDQWLSAVESDRRSVPLATKVREDKPAAAVDACWIGDQEVTDQQTCRAAYPFYGSTRMAAGGPLADNVMKCRLKPLNRADYNVTFTGDQWARLEKTFPDGVCDWTKPGVDQQPSIPWMTFAGGPGGKPLGRAPASKRMHRHRRHVRHRRRA